MTPAKTRCLVVLMLVYEVRVGLAVAFPSLCRLAAVTSHARPSAYRCRYGLWVALLLSYMCRESYGNKGTSAPANRGWVAVAHTKRIDFTEVHPISLPATVQRSEWTQALCKSASRGLRVLGIQRGRVIRCVTVCSHVVASSAATAEATVVLPTPPPSGNSVDVTRSPSHPATQRPQRTAATIP